MKTFVCLSAIKYRNDQIACRTQCSKCRDMKPKHSNPKRYAKGLEPPRYPMPVDIGHVSIGQDYKGVSYIDSADEDDPIIVWIHDTWLNRIDGWYTYYPGHCAIECLVCDCVCR